MVVFILISIVKAPIACCQQSFFGFCNVYFLLLVACVQGPLACACHCNSPSCCHAWEAFLISSTHRYCTFVISWFMAYDTFLVYNLLFYLCIVGVLIVTFFSGSRFYNWWSWQHGWQNLHGWNSMKWMKLTKSWKFHMGKIENYVNGWRCVSILGIDRYMLIPFSYPYNLEPTFLTRKPTNLKLGSL
jgi:hypothetical protein